MCATSSIPVSKMSGVHPRILCVDTSAEMLEICKSILEAEGYQVFTAPSGAEALQLLRLHSVDAVVVDDSVSGMTAMALAKEIKLTTMNVVVVMYSAELNAGEELPFIDSFLYKGNGPIALRALLGTLLQK